MKANRMPWNGLILFFIILFFGIGSCTPPASVPSLTSTPTAYSTPLAIDGCDANKIAITDVSWFREPDGAWRVVGMMHNNSSRPISKLTMAILTKKANDELVYPDGPKGETYSVYPLNLVPGGQALFSAWIKREIPGLDHFTIEQRICVFAEPTERVQMQERGGRLLVDDTGLAHVTLEVVNRGSRTALINGLMVGVFDDAGHLISAIDAQVTPRILAPGERGPVRATLVLPPDSAAQVKDYKVYMDALVDEPRSELLDAPIDLQTSAQYLDTSGHFHLVGQMTNAGTRPLMVSVQATVYADSDRSAVVDTAFVNTLIPLAPGESMPFDLTDWRVLNNEAGLWQALSKQNAAVALRVEPFHTWIADSSVAPLTVLAQPPTFSRQEAIFTGEVKNETGHNIILGTVTVTFRDSASDKITATVQTPLKIVNALAAGETLRYSVAIPLGSDFDPQTVQFEVTASGQQT